LSGTGQPWCHVPVAIMSSRTASGRGRTETCHRTGGGGEGSGSAGPGPAATGEGSTGSATGPLVHAGIISGRRTTKAGPTRRVGGHIDAPRGRLDARARLTSRVAHDAELVSLGIGEGDEDVVRVLGGPQALPAQLFDPRRGRLLVGDAQVDV